MSFAWETQVPIPDRVHAISLRDLSLLVAERHRLEALGAPRVSAIEVGRLPSRARRRSYNAGRRRTTYTGPRMTKDAA